MKDHPQVFCDEIAAFYNLFNFILFIFLETIGFHLILTVGFCKSLEFNVKLLNAYANIIIIYIMFINYLN